MVISFTFLEITHIFIFIAKLHTTRIYFRALWAIIYIDSPAVSTDDLNLRIQLKVLLSEGGLKWPSSGQVKIYIWQILTSKLKSILEIWQFSPYLD